MSRDAVRHCVMAGLCSSVEGIHSALCDTLTPLGFEVYPFKVAAYSLWHLIVKGFSVFSYALDNLCMQQIRLASQAALVLYS